MISVETLLPEISAEEVKLREQLNRLSFFKTVNESVGNTLIPAELDEKIKALEGQLEQLKVKAA